VGYQVLRTSAKTGEGLDDLRAECCSGSSALIGPSGAGKSSLLNALEPALALRTGELSRATKAGRHTTVGSRMIPLACGGVVADTPGFSDIGLWSVDARDVADCFPEFRAHAELCRFRGCSHLHEPGCAVREALAAGEVTEDRYRSYAALHQEAVEATKEA
jgi:ribosome biogenesis GTPase